MYSIVSEIQTPSISSIKDYVSGLKELSSSDLRIFLIYKGKELIGVIDGFRDDPLENRFYIGHFAIKKEHQLKGNGRILMARAYARLNKMGYSEIEMVGLQGARHINLQLTGNKEFKNGKFRKFLGRTEYELPDFPNSSFIKIKKIQKPHVK